MKRQNIIRTWDSTLTKYKKSGSKSILQFVDNRSEVVAQRKLQEVANNSNPLIQFNGRKRTYSEAFGEDDQNIYEPPKKKRRLLGINRLHRAYLRNRYRKAKPVSERAVFGRQKKHNYGYENKVIDYGSVKGNFYKGPFVGQPYLSISKEDYGLESKPSTTYDEIVKGLESFDDDAELAKIIINKIELGTELPDLKNKTVMVNASLIIQLTQFIEPHESRVPGIDKLARSFFRHIATGNMTFRQVFNRKDGAFVVARAKAGGAKYGGQEAGRTLVGIGAKKSDKSTIHDIWTSTIDQVADDMSDSSDEE